MEMNSEYLVPPDSASPAPNPSASLESVVIFPEDSFSSPEPIDGNVIQEILEPPLYDDVVLLDKLDQIHQDLFMMTVILLLLFFRGIFKRYSSNIKGRC